MLVSSALLVAGAIENARLFEETRRRVGELEALIDLGETVAAAESLDELLPGAAQRARDLLGADVCHLYVLEPASEELRLRASAPAGVRHAHDDRALRARPRARPSRAEGHGHRSPRRRRRAPRPSRRRRHLRARPRTRGSGADRPRPEEGRADRAPDGEEPDQGLLRGARRRPRAARDRRPSDPPRRGRRPPPPRPVASPADDELEATIRRVAPRALFDRRDDSLRALVPVPSSGPTRWRRICERSWAKQTPPSRSASRTRAPEPPRSPPASRRRGTPSSARR